MSSITNRICSILKTPFLAEWNFYVLLLTSVFLYIVGYWLSSQTGLVVFVCSLFCIYCISVIVSLLPKPIKKTIIFLILVYIYAVALLTFFGGLFTKTPDPMFVLSLILQTNSNEISDFFSTNITKFSIFATIITILVLYLLYKLLRSNKTLSRLRYRYKYLLVLLSLSMSCSFYVKDIFKAMPITVPFAKPLDNFVIKDLNDYVVKPQLIETRSHHPQYVVLIVGESFSKSHSSLYGYQKQTNPKLQLLKDKEGLFAFKKVSSSTAYTGGAFKDIMSTYSTRNRDEEWWTCQTIPTIMKAEGYKTFWISNQQAMGLYDAIPSHYADLCETKNFTPAGNHYDGDLVKLVKNQLCKNVEGEGKNEFYIIHLMGSHEVFKKRYPEEYNRFKSTDYSYLPEHQRQAVAEYDNSVLYNDYVISEFIALFNKQDACIVYFPDHALDLFESDDNYFGHANGTTVSQNVAKQIPFMVYLSKSFIENDSSVVQRVKSSVDKPFSTQDIIYTITDLSGYKFADSDEISKYSLFKGIE